MIINNGQQSTELIIQKTQRSWYHDGWNINNFQSGMCFHILKETLNGVVVNSHWEYSLVSSIIIIGFVALIFKDYLQGI